MVYNTPMKPYRIVLGSASPRRKELLSRIVPTFEVRPSSVDERCLLTSPTQYVMYTAAKKALGTDVQDGEILLTADTIVTIDGAFLGKPADDRDAVSMLKRLNHRVNTVYTGVCLRTTDSIELFYEASDVRIDMTEAEIEAYVAAGYAADKAGAYGIQDPTLRATLLRGSLDNVIGLPVEAVAARLVAFTRRNKE